MTYEELPGPLALQASPVCSHSHPAVVGLNIEHADVVYDFPLIRRKPALLSYMLDCGCDVPASGWTGYRLESEPDAMWFEAKR